MSSQISLQNLENPNPDSTSSSQIHPSSSIIDESLKSVNNTFKKQSNSFSNSPLKSNHHNEDLMSSENTTISSKDVFQMFESFHQTSQGTFKASFYNPFEVKHRKRTTKDQQVILENYYSFEEKPDCDSRRSLASKLAMTPRAVQVWFQNRRAKHRNNLSIFLPHENFQNHSQRSHSISSSFPVLGRPDYQESRQRSLSCTSMATKMMDDMSISTFSSGEITTINHSNDISRKRSSTAPLMSFQGENIHESLVNNAKSQPQQKGSHLRPIAPNPLHLLKKDLPKDLPFRRHSVTTFDVINGGISGGSNNTLINVINSNGFSQPVLNFIPITSPNLSGRMNDLAFSSPGGAQTNDSPTKRNNFLPFKELKDAIFGREQNTTTSIFKDQTYSYPSLSEKHQQKQHHQQPTSPNSLSFVNQSPSSPSKGATASGTGATFIPRSDDPNTNYIRYIQLQQQLQMKHHNNSPLLLPPPSPNMSYSEYLSHIQAYNRDLPNTSRNISFYNPFISNESEEDPMASGNSFTYFSSPVLTGITSTSNTSNHSSTTIPNHPNNADFFCSHL